MHQCVCYRPKVSQFYHFQVHYMSRIPFPILKACPFKNTVETASINVIYFVTCGYLKKLYFGEKEDYQGKDSENTIVT